MDGLFFFSDILRSKHYNDDRLSVIDLLIIFRDHIIAREIDHVLSHGTRNKHILQTQKVPYTVYKNQNSTLKLNYSCVLHSFVLFLIPICRTCGFYRFMSHQISVKSEPFPVYRLVNDYWSAPFYVLPTIDNISHIELHINNIVQYLKLPPVLYCTHPYTTYNHKNPIHLLI